MMNLVNWINKALPGCVREVTPGWLDPQGSGVSGNYNLLIHNMVALPGRVRGRSGAQLEEVGCWVCVLGGHILCQSLPVCSLSLFPILHELPHGEHQASLPCTMKLPKNVVSHAQPRKGTEACC